MKYLDGRIYRYCADIIELKRLIDNLLMQIFTRLLNDIASHLGYSMMSVESHVDNLQKMDQYRIKWLLKIDKIRVLNQPDEMESKVQ